MGETGPLDALEVATPPLAEALDEAPPAWEAAKAPAPNLASYHAWVSARLPTKELACNNSFTYTA